MNTICNSIKDFAIVSSGIAQVKICSEPDSVPSNGKNPGHCPPESPNLQGIMLDSADTTATREQLLLCIHTVL